jgi:L,D-transpeptidase YcbB
LCDGTGASAIALEVGIKPERADVGDTMRPGVPQAFSYSDSRNELAWLVLRVIGRLAPCTETSLVAYISRDYTKSETPTGRVFLDALLKLKALGFIESTEEQIGITDAGRGFLDELPVNHASLRAPYAAVFLRTHVTPSLAEHTARLKRLCQLYLAQAYALTRRGFPNKGHRAPTIASILRRAPLIASRATTHMLRHATTSNIIVRNWLRQTRALLWKSPGAGGLILKPKFAGRSQWVIFGGALLVVALITAAGLAFVSGKREAPPVIDTVYRASAHPDTAEPNAPPTLITRIEPIRIAIQNRFSTPLTASERRKREQGTIVEYYSVPTKPLLWVDDNGLTDGAKSVMEEIARADEYGLHAADYELPEPGGFSPHDDASVDWLADAEVKISLAVLRYAQDARGGRIKPARLSKNLDPTLALPDPLEILDTMASREDPAVYLRSFHPSQPQFEALRQKLLEIRREAETPKPSIIIPEGPVLKKGVEHAHVALLRKRLEVSSGDRNESRYDELLHEAVRSFQTEHGIAPDGIAGASTRRALNKQSQAQEKLATQRLILLNMERWRWLPHDLGSLYVHVNVPEFIARVIKNGTVIQASRVVVGKPDTQTPIFSDEVQEVVFGPYWNVPTSIKVEEIRPYLGEEAPWFFGGGGWNTSVFRRHGLRIRYGGQEVDPGTIDWNHVDIRNLEIFQPPGPDNVLGRVKFVFPNKHDVYMHDTTQKELFAKAIRAESHGCVRVQNPDELAAILLDYDQGWSAARVESAIQNGYDQHVALRHKIPVHITYFTLWVNDDGSMSNFGDLYGHDARMATALFGDSMGFAYPSIAKKVPEAPLPPGNQAPWDDAAGDDIVGSIIRLLGN